MARNDPEKTTKQKSEKNKAKAKRKRKSAGSRAVPPPRGRDEIMKVVLEAAAELFAERSPRLVSIREIAERANVKHSLIHRHFGTKAQLLDEVIKHSSRDYVQKIVAIADPAEAFREGFLYGAEEHPEAAATTRAVLAGYAPADAERSFPMMARHVKLLEDAVAAQRARPHYSPQVIAAAAFALMSGWFILEDWLIEAAGLEDRSLAAVRAEVADILAGMVTAQSGLKTGGKSVA